MKTKLEKHIEINEIIYEQNGSCITPKSIGCEECPHETNGCYQNYNHKERKNMAKAFLAKHKPEETMISKEELIEKCKGKVFKCESQEEWDLCVEKVKSVGITPMSDDSFTYMGVSGLGCFRLSSGLCKFIQTPNMPNSNSDIFLSLFTPSVTIDKNVTAVENPAIKLHRLVKPIKVGKINPHEPVLTNREQILKNKKDVVEVCDRALVCYAPEGYELCRFEGGLYRTAKGLNPKDMGRVSDWYRNLESVKVGV